MASSAHIEQAIRAVKKLAYANQAQAAQEAERTLVPLGHTLMQKHDWAAAAEVWSALARFFPAAAAPWVSLGQVGFFSGNLASAAEAFGEALKRDPMLHEARLNRGIVLQQLGQWESAEEELGRVYPIYGPHPELAIALGKCLARRGHIRQAIDLLTLSLSQNSGHVRLHVSLGYLHEQTGELEEALRCYDEALAISPQDLEAQASRGNVLGYLMRLDEARATLENALRIRPDYAPAMVNLGFIERMQGNWKRGLELMEARFQLNYRKPRQPAPEWEGQDLSGKTLFLYNEQGLGDVLMLARYVPLLHRRYGCRIVMSVAPTLAELSERLEGAAEVTTATEPPAGCDYMQSISSVQRVLGETPETVPAEVPYLRADNAKVDQWRARIGNDRVRRIGLFWRGTKTDVNRAISLSDLLPLWEAAEDARFYSLQKGPGEEEIAGFPKPITALGQDLASFDDTAAVLALMDLVITIDTSVAHCAGGMARPTWTMLPFRPDWRWGLGGETCRAYPTMRLFRQQQRGDWQPVIATVAENLREWAKK